MRERCRPPDRSSAHFVCGLGGPVGEVMRSRRRRHKIPSHQKFSSFLVRLTPYSGIPHCRQYLTGQQPVPAQPLRHETSDVSQRAWFPAIQSRFPNLHDETTHRRRTANCCPSIQPGLPIHTKCRCAGLPLISPAEDGWLGLPSGENILSWHPVLATISRPPFVKVYLPGASHGASITQNDKMGRKTPNPPPGRSLS